MKKTLLPLLAGEGRVTYARQIQKMTNLLGYWPLWDLTGNNAEEISGRNKTGGYNGTKTLAQPGIGDGRTSALFVTGATSGVNVFSVSPISMDEGFASFWAAAASATSWSDSGTYFFATLSTDFTNGIYLRKINGSLSFYRRAGGVLPAVTMGLLASARWVNFGFMWSVALQKVWITVNGTKSIPIAGTVNSLTGNLTAASALFGANTTVATTTWPGRMAHCVVGSSLPTDAQMWTIGRLTRQVVFDGDSRSVADKNWHTTALEAAFPTGDYALGGRGLGVWAVTGRTVASMIAGAAAGVDTRIKPGAVNTLFVWAGINSYATGAAQIYSDLQAYVAARRAAGWNKIILCNEIDGQTAALDAAGWHGTIWPALNTLLDNDHSFADGYVDLGGDARLQNALDTTYFNADKLHLNAAGYAVVAELAAPIIGAVA